MTRRALLLGLVSPTLAWPAPVGFSVRGNLTATADEDAQGYYALGSELAIVTTPNSPVHAHLRALVNRDVLLVMEAR